MIRAVLFDLDDTLYEYAPCNEAGLAAAYMRLAADVDVSPEGFRGTHDEVRAELARELAGQAASHNRTLYFKRIVERLTGAPRPALALECTETYWRAFEERMQPVPEAHDVLASLSLTFRLAIVSNQTTEVQLRKLERLGLSRYFVAVVTSEEVGVEKPDVRMFEAALRAVDVPAAEAAMIGDDPQADIRGAREAGLRTIHCTRFASGEADADARVASLNEIAAALD